MTDTLRTQPDDPGIAICPCCKQIWPDEDADALRFVRGNAGKHPPLKLAQWLNWPLERLQRLARKQRPPIDLTYRGDASA